MAGPVTGRFAGRADLVADRARAPPGALDGEGRDDRARRARRGCGYYREAVSSGAGTGMNRGHTYREQVGAAAAGRTLLAHLRSRPGTAGEDEWRARIAAGLVRLEGRAAAAGEVLRAGQWLTWERPPWCEPEVPLSTAVLHEDPELLAVAKPRGLPTLPGGGAFLEHTLLELVRRRAPGASPMHRLGRFTSGVVLFARTAAAAPDVQAAFRSSGVRKVYRALCAGHPARDAFTVDAPIGTAAHPLLGTVHASCMTGRPSRSHVRVLERRGAGSAPDLDAPVSLLEVEIETGRPHQIRIHLAHAGHPLAGDPLYGPGGVPLPGSRALPGDPGYRLHAMRLELVHPRTGAPVALECAPPPCLRAPEDRIPPGAPPGMDMTRGPSGPRMPR
jgi:23S rRNA pseudouridine1911/1915/1917 synthase